MLAAWTRSEYAWLAQQTPADTLTGAGTMLITRHPVRTIARTVLDRLPPAPGPGRLPTDSDVKLMHRPLVGDTSVRDVLFGDETGGAADAFAPNVAVGVCGSITIRAGSIVDGFQPTAIEARYRDVVGDGRYVLIVDRPAVALAAEGDSLVRLVNRVISLARDRHDTLIAEREELNF